MMYRFLTLVCVIVSFVIVGCQPKVDRSSFIPEELEFLKKYPEVELSQIPVEWRGIFMAGYEEYHPVLDGRDVIFLSSEQE
ncbi:MAG: DUF3526 domain-containing protein, partial [Planctomycetaceae bacterium]|nr:DUF3526 domain-containing protein [Planctomycetaceae bacterium]